MKDRSIPGRITEMARRLAELRWAQERGQPLGLSFEQCAGLFSDGESFHEMTRYTRDGQVVYRFLCRNKKLNAALIKAGLTKRKDDHESELNIDLVDLIDNGGY